MIMIGLNIIRKTLYEMRVTLNEMRETIGQDKKECRFSQSRLNCTVDEPNHTRQGPKRDRLSAERSEKSICKMDSELWHRARNTGKGTVTVFKKEINYFLCCVLAISMKAKFSLYIFAL